MKQITLQISDAAFSDLRTLSVLSMMTDNKGPVAEAMVKILKAMDKGQKEIRLVLREDDDPER